MSRPKEDCAEIGHTGGARGAVDLSPDLLEVLGDMDGVPKRAALLRLLAEYDRRGMKRPEGWEDDLAQCAPVEPAESLDDRKHRKTVAMIGGILLWLFIGAMAIGAGALLAAS